jgi:general secretion pathway protein E
MREKMAESIKTTNLIKGQVESNDRLEKEINQVEEEKMAKEMALRWRIPFIEKIMEEGLDNEIISKIPIQFAKKNKIVPIGKNGNSLKVAISDPYRFQPIDDLRSLLGLRIEIFLAPEKEIINAINRVYDRQSHSPEEIIQLISSQESDRFIQELEETEDLLDSQTEAPVIKLVNIILSQAIRSRASDIHIEPFENDLKIRYRIDGILYNILSPPKGFHSAITSRIKVMARMDIAEKRLPQDGRIRIKIANRDFDIRVSTIPTTFGERVVLRLLDKSSVLLGLHEIGLSVDHLEKIKKLIRSSHGIILVTGPTGSGKTTTLYAALSEINTPDKNIITIEDPVEYQLNGIGQIQVNPKIDLTFANGLRSIVRQDPDVILVGEIRDSETAEISIHAALTGHLVFSTLHTNDAAGAITRLIDMGVEPFLVSSSLNAVVGQRLVRIICPNCKEPYYPNKESLEEMNINPEILMNRPLFRGRGCGECMQTGYRGRTGIFEFLVMSDDLRNLILKTTDSNTIKRAAVNEGMMTLREDGIMKVLDGITTIEEVLRVTVE